jgi:hypothetical protein
MADVERQPLPALWPVPAVWTDVSDSLAFYLKAYKPRAVALMRGLAAALCCRASAGIGWRHLGRAFESGPTYDFA